MRVRCPQANHPIDVPDDFVGTQVFCPQCKCVVVLDPKGDRVLSLTEAAKAQNIQFTMGGFYDIRRPNGRNELVAVNTDRQEGAAMRITQITAFARYSLRNQKINGRSTPARRSRKRIMVRVDRGKPSCLC